MLPSGTVTPASIGRDVWGPIVAEFCLRLWTLESSFVAPDDVALLFCARGGLRMQLAYERFLASSGLTSPTRLAPLMVSRVVAIRPALVRGMQDGAMGLLPAAAATLSYEFPQSTIAQVAFAIAGVSPATAGDADVPFTPAGFDALLRHPDGQPVVTALRDQAALFNRHLRQAMGSRPRAVLVDTGLYGTTRQLLAEGVPDLDFSSALVARSFRGAPAQQAKTFGLSVEAAGYSPLRRRTALLRHWHFVEWMFEPPLQSVRSFTADHGVVRSNLEVAGWQDRVGPEPGSAFAGVLEYLDGLGHRPGTRIVQEADRAWRALRRAVVWPDSDSGHALSVGLRSHDFGTEGTWTARPWAGPFAALRGSTMWREGEIARSGTVLRLPLLAVIEAGYSTRLALRRARSVLRDRTP